MYVNQIDDIIDKILDQLYLEGISKDPTFQTIVQGNKINYVEYRDKINKFIQNFMTSIDITPIQKLINNKENLLRILDIIKRYIAYYYFLSIAYYYTGTLKDFRNNLIQYSKMQENSTFTIKNFFDTENNYQIINFYRIIKDVSNIVMMTELQKKTVNPLEFKDALNFLNNLGKDFIDNYLLMIISENGEDKVQINVHNLIKTIVFREIYRNQEQMLVFEILNDIEEVNNEYTFIDIIVTNDDVIDFNSFRQIFMGEENTDVLARDLYELANESTKVPQTISIETKNSNLLELNIITPIVDDFLRYHRDTERLDVDDDKSFNIPLVSTNNAKNVQLALLYQQRKKKENTKAQLIVNKIDAITDYYSDNVKNNPEFLKTIKQYFQNPFHYRKAVLHNHLEEVRVLNKIFNQGRKVIEGNEYYLSLKQIVQNAYFNFKDLQKYGTSVTIFPKEPINMLRYNNIEYQSQMPQLQVDMHTGVEDSTIHLVGLALGPFDEVPIQCVRKANMVDIRGINISYYKNGEIVTTNTNNGYKAFRKIIKHFFINTITISTGHIFYLYNDYSQVRELNPDIFSKIIYWVYDPSSDEFEMDIYENLKTDSSTEIIKLMNSLIYDDIVKYLERKLVNLINDNLNFSSHQTQLLLEWFSNKYGLFLKQDEKRQVFINEYLKKIKLEPSQIKSISNTELVEKPVFHSVDKSLVFKIRIDMINPVRPHEYLKLEAYTKEAQNTNIIGKVESKCQHENQWNELIKMKKENLNIYNMAITQFIEKFAIETQQLEFICRVCGQVLPLKQYTQDGNFDNNTQKFVTAYTPLDIPLEDIKEYSKYKLTIRYLDKFINRMSLITGTNMLVGPNTAIKQRRKALVKNIIDLIVKHNTVNLQKNQNSEERMAFYSKRFNIDKDLDIVHFFELDDSIINFDPNSTDLNLNRLKYNNVLLYFILIFITELNGTQIATMYFDKYANIFVFLKYGVKLFGNLTIRKNITDAETAPITDYPVLCYLIYLMGYFMFKYRLWYHPAANTNQFNPYYIKIIINSFVDLFNSISIDAGKMLNDYVYLLTTQKLYGQLYTTLKDNYIINVLKSNHLRFSDNPNADKISIAIKDNLVKPIFIKDGLQIVLPTRKLPSYKLSSGINYYIESAILYPYQKEITDITNCPYGSYHFWSNKGNDIQCLFCEESRQNVTGNIDRSVEAYYYDLNKIAHRRCIEGTYHDFDHGICVICGRKYNEIFTFNDTYRMTEAIRDKTDVDFYLKKFRKTIKEMYNRDDLDKLEKNLDRIENNNIKQLLEIISKQKKEDLELENLWDTSYNDLISSYRTETSDKLYGQINVMVDKLIDILESEIGVDTDLGISKYPVYLRDNVYVINHSFDGTALNDIIILTEKDGRINFRENHPFFKTDVYYYTDNKNQIDVFYHAVTLKLLGYKEKHKDYILINQSDAYLIINPSIKNRLLTIGYPTKYIDIGEIFDKNSKTITDTNENFFQILDGLIREHVYKTRTIVDKISSIIYKIKNYIPSNEVVDIPLQTTQSIDKLVSKYAQLFKDIHLPDNEMTFNDWNILRDMFDYEKINWMDTNVRPTENMYINSDMVNYYDISSNLMIYYLVNELISIIDNNTEKITKTNIAQMYIEIINYIYNLYNIDIYKNSHEFKRFDYILNGSEYIVDILKKGQGLQQSKELEEDLVEGDEENAAVEGITEEEKEEIDDLKEEAEALDIEGDYFAEEDQDYAQTEENE